MYPDFSFGVVFFDISKRVSKVRGDGSCISLMRTQGDHVGVRIPEEQLYRVGVAYGDSSVASVRNIVPSLGEPGLLPGSDGGIEGSAGVVFAKVVLGEFLDELLIVEWSSSGGGLVLLHIDFLRASALVLQAGRLGLKQRLVYNHAPEEATGLHGRNTREDARDLPILAAIEGDLAEEQQLVGRHSDKVRCAASTRERGQAVRLCRVIG